MPASYDEQGNYEYPEGFDPETGEWLPGYEKQREEWEHQYAEARARFEAHRRQVEESRAWADEEETAGGGEAGGDTGAATGAPRGGRGGRSGGPRQGGSPGAVTSSSTPGTGATGTLASDEALAALREKLSGGQS